MLYGEISKFVPMSSKRFTRIFQSSSDVLVSLEGAVGEKVDFWFRLDGDVKKVTCVHPATGTALVSIKNVTCKPT